MFRTLRGRLIASHVGLLLIVIPLTGLALIYLLETRVVLANLARQLTGQAALVAELLAAEPEAGRDPAAAETFVARVGPLFPGHLALLTPLGRTLASSDPAQTAGDVLATPGLASAAAGQPYSRVIYRPGYREEIADVMLPVIGPDGQVSVIIRLYDHLEAAEERFWRLRGLTAGVLAAGLIVGALIGLRLALTIERPLARLTAAADAFTVHGELAPLPDRGSRETLTLARAFRNMAGRLRHQEEARSRLLAHVIHELGRPLAALRAATRALLDGAAGEPPLAAELLQGMDDEIGRMAGLLDELAALRERTAGPLALALQPVDLAAWLPAVLAPWAAAAGAAGLRWAADLTGLGDLSGLPQARIDPDRLAAALGNLLSNAVKFTPRGGAVAVTSGADADGWYCRVADTGPGIAPDDQARIFEPFARVPPGRRYPPGLGLGLAIARDIVLAHGGTLTVASEPGAGAAFTVRIQT